MGNEMGNSNISGLKEEENTAVEARENFSQEANRVDDVKGETRGVPAGEGKDFHEKVEGLSSDDPSGAGDPQVEKQTVDGKEQDDTELKHSLESIEVSIGSNDAASQETGIQATSSPKDLNCLEKATESKLEENLLGTSDHPIKNQTPTRREEVEASNSTYEPKSALLTAEPLESVAVSQINQHEHGEVHAESLAEGHDGSPSCQAEEIGKLLENESTQNLAESVASDAELEEEKTKDESLLKKTASQENLADTSISDEKHEITSKDEVENGSSKSPQEVNSQANSSNTFEAVPEPQDKCMVLAEDTEMIESLSENEETKHDPNPIQFHEQAVNESKTDEVNASQPESMQVCSGSGNGKESIVDSSCNSAMDKDSQMKEVKVAENGYQLDTCNGKDSEEFIETVPTELTVTEHNHEEEEEEPTEKKVIKAVEEKAEKLKALGSGTEAKEATEQSLEVDYENSLLSASSGHLLKSQDQHQDTLIGSETVESRAMLLTDLKRESCSRFFVTKASSVDSNNSSKQIMVPTVGLENGKPEQDLRKCSETETSLEQSNEQCAEVETTAFLIAGRLSTGSIPENPNIHAELKKSPSFDFDLSLEARSEESDQTPLLHHNKIATRSLSSLDGASFGNPTAQSKYGQYQAISVEEKTIKVERSDSDMSRAPFLNFLKEEEKAKVVVTSQKQDGHVAEDKTVKDSSSKEVAVTKGSGKRKPRPSLFSTCICCAAAIN